MTLLDRTIVRLLPAVPKPVVQLFSSRYIAGSTLADAVATVRKLNGAGELATIDVLGEEITREDEARAIAQAYRDVFAAIEREHLDSNVSVKLTALGLDLSYDLCKDNMESVLREAAKNGNFVRIDMEDSSTTSRRCVSTASYAVSASTTSASCSRRICAARWTTSRRSPT